MKGSAWIALERGVGVASLAWAAEPHGAHLQPSLSDLFWPILNFLLFLGLLYRFAGPVLRAALADRRRRIEGELREAERIEREARELRAEVEGLRAAEQEERVRILETLRAEAERERAAVVGAARSAAERLRADARRLGEQEAARAVLEIRRAVAHEAARRAEIELRSRVGEAEEELFANQFLQAVEGDVG